LLTCFHHLGGITNFEVTEEEPMSPPDEIDILASMCYGIAFYCTCGQEKSESQLAHQEIGVPLPTFNETVLASFRASAGAGATLLLLVLITTITASMISGWILFFHWET